MTEKMSCGIIVNGHRFKKNVQNISVVLLAAAESHQLLVSNRNLTTPQAPALQRLPSYLDVPD